MKSRTVRPIKKKQSAKKKNNRNLSETQPMRPVRIQSGYSQYRDTLERRREMLQSTQRPVRSVDPYRHSGVRQNRPTRYTAPAQNRPVRKTQKKKRSNWEVIKLSLFGKASEKEQYFDFDLLVVIIFLMCFGLVMLYSVSSYEAQADFGNDMYYFVKQALIGAGGLIIMFIVSKIDYHIMGAFSFEAFAIAMILMGLVQTPIGITVNGARRWLPMPGNMTFQPAEVTKIAVILFISFELCRLGKKAYTMKGMVRVLAFGAVASMGVLFLTDNLSTAIIVAGITCLLIFVIHPKTKPFIIFLAVCSIVLIAGIAILSVTAVNSDNFRLQRILSWLNPEATASEGSFQVMQGLYAIGSGGLFGKGLGNSTQKLGVIPEAQNDMILVVICEELGICGALIILILFGLLLYRLMFIAKNAPDLYGSLVATGIFAHISLQVVLNIGVVTGLLPTTGITLPFISYGGTAVIFLLAEMGIALGISRKIKLE